MKKLNLSVFRTGLLLFGMVSIPTSLFLVFSPGAYAGQVSADCSNGGSVQCDGYNCTATDNVGCSCKDSSGKVTEKQSCPKGGGEELLLD